MMASNTEIGITISRLLTTLSAASVATVFNRHLAGRCIADEAREPDRQGQKYEHYS